MNKALPRILGLVSLFVLGFVALSLLSNIAQLANLAESALPGAGQIVFWCLVLVFAGLLITPLAIYFKLPKPLSVETQLFSDLEWIRTVVQLLQQDAYRCTGIRAAVWHQLAILDYGQHDTA